MVLRVIKKKSVEFLVYKMFIFYGLIIMIVYCLDNFICIDINWSVLNKKNIR